jgi:tetratricopeptide (TPR) repeat protein
MRGDPRAAHERLEEARAATRNRQDRRLELRARIELAALDLFGDSPNVAAALELAGEAIPYLELCDDDRSLARSWLLVGYAQGQFLCDNTALENAGMKATEHSRKAGWSPSACVGSIGNALFFGPHPVGDAIEVAERLLRDHHGDRATEANISLPLAGLYAMSGRFDDAYSTVERGASNFQELGHTRGAEILGNYMRAEIEILAGRPDAAESFLRASCEGCLRFNELAELASRAAELADVLVALARDDEAQEWLGISRAHADQEDLHAQSLLHSVAAKTQAHNGLTVEAEALARQAVEIAQPTDGLNLKARIYSDLAEVLLSCGDEAAAVAALEAAIALYEEKGNRVAAHRSRATLTAKA